MDESSSSRRAEGALSFRCSVLDEDDEEDVDSRGTGKVSLRPNDNILEVLEVGEMAPVWRVSRKRWLCE
jgi:hypothetical protein